MTSRNFRIRYWLQSLETRSSPLFSTVRAYLLTDSLKRLIGQSAPIRDGKLYFQAQLDEQAKSLKVDSRGGYAEAKVTVLLEFGAEGRFIKMGETQVNLADILNHSKSGEALSYRVEKCYDRNARITLTVTFYETGLQRTEEGESHSRSHCLLPPSKIKLRTAVNKHKITTTQYEQMTDREEKEEQMSLISDRHNSIGRTLNRTEAFLRKPPNLQEVLDLKTENRIYQHQLAQMQQRYREAQDEAENLREEVQVCRTELFRISTECETVKNQLQDKEQLKESQREQLAAEVARMLKLYQESQQERNKLLIQREEEASKEKERARDAEKRVSEERNKAKQLERSEQTLRKKVEEYMSQIAIYEKAVRSEKKSKQKAMQALQAESKSIGALNSQLQLSKQSAMKLTQSNSQMQSQLQISRFSLCELQKQLILLRRTSKGQQQQLSHYQSELKISSDSLRTERNNFSRRLQELEQDSQREQRNLQAYLQELEIKSTNEHNKNGIINSLKKEVSRLKHEVTVERERADEIEGQLSIMGNSGKLLQAKLEEYQAKILQLSRQNALLESEIKSRKAQQEAFAANVQIDGGISQQERQQLIALSYQERDDVWKKEIEAIQSDMNLLIQKTKRQKEQHTKTLKKLNQDLATCEDSLKKAKYKIKDMAEEEQKTKKSAKELQDKCLQLQRKNNQQQLQCTRWQHQVAELSKRLQCIQQLEEALRQAEKKFTSSKNESESLRNDLQKEKQLRQRLRSDIKELVNVSVTYLNKSQKHRIFYDQLHAEHIDTELLLVFNSACKLYCDRHNRLRGKLENLEQLKGQLQTKEKEYEKINKSLRDQRRSQGGSCDSNTSINHSQTQSVRIMTMMSVPTTTKMPQKQEIQIRGLKRQIDQLKNKLRKQANRYNQLERDTERMRHSLEQTSQDLRRAKQDAQVKGEQLNDVKERLKAKEKQFDSSKEELKETMHEITTLKNQLQEVTRAFKQQKNQALKRSTVNRSFSGRNERQEDTVKTFQLEKRLRIAQQQLDKLRREKEDKRNDAMQNKQMKTFQARLKQKDDAIAALRDNLDEEREKSEQTKQLQTLKLRKLKQQFEQQLQSRTKTQKQLSQALSEAQEKLRQMQKKLKLTQQSLKNANAQLVCSAQREEKAKRMIAAEWELKMKSTQGELQAQITNLTKRVDELRLAQRTAKDGERRKEKQVADARLQLQRSERAAAELTERLELCGVRLKNMEQEESNYKEVIGALQSKIKVESSEQRRMERDAERDTFDNHSNFSLKTFTFR